MSRTQGTWDMTGRLGHGWYVESLSGQPIAVFYGDTSNPDGEANARFCAVAPDLAHEMKCAVLRLRVLRAICRRGGVPSGAELAHEIERDLLAGLRAAGEPDL